MNRLFSLLRRRGQAGNRKEAPLVAQLAEADGPVSIWDYWPEDEGRISMSDLMDHVPSINLEIEKGLKNCQPFLQALKSGGAGFHEWDDLYRGITNIDFNHNGYHINMDVLSVANMAVVKVRREKFEEGKLIGRDTFEYDSANLWLDYMRERPGIGLESRRTKWAIKCFKQLMQELGSPKQLSKTTS